MGGIAPPMGGVGNDPSPSHGRGLLWAGLATAQAPPSGWSWHVAKPRPFWPPAKKAPPPFFDGPGNGKGGSNASPGRGRAEKNFCLTCLQCTAMEGRWGMGHSHSLRTYT
uniref:RLORF1 n=1 Tax=anatid alphaherpesvirus 1 TaxID=104388 RepID=E7D237_9ALPH|nr:RLORF1 [Anatid alphaherpesvirus 1]